MSDYVSVDVETTVALRKESVDRNNASPTARVFAVVALRKESVDRNPMGMHTGCIAGLSLSARRAWIEMPVLC